MEEMVVVTPEKLEKLMKQKLEAAGLHSEHAEEVARHLTFADASGIHSHGAGSYGLLCGTDCKRRDHD